MLKRLSLVKKLFRDLPRQIKLAYNLLFDERVSPASKVAVVAALGLIVTPFVNLPEWIPVLGEMDVLALTLVATGLFIKTAPGEVVEEHERLAKQRQSRFDLDVARGSGLATALARRFGRKQEVEFVGVAQERASASRDVSGVNA